MPRKKKPKPWNNSGPEGIYETLALDPGRACGWAAGDTLVGVRESGTLDLHCPLDERYLRLLRWLQNHPPAKAIVIEEPVALRSTASRASIYGLIAVASAFAGTTEIELHRYRPKEAKAHTGYGSASKYDMLKWAKLEHKIEAKTDDEADAIALLSLHLHRSRLTWT
jgi:Holliday junction resolvasome RuvABC endonuclease subunit